MSKIEFPIKVKYNRNLNRIYFITDFEDGEELEFAYRCEKPSSDAIGNVWYKSCKTRRIKLVNIKELVEI